ncbi:MAG: signal peptidase II [Actinomycetota bacterium]|nr:signal peptidase II [Actinomycetota bacterium]
MNRRTSVVAALAISLSAFIVDQAIKRVVEGAMGLGESLPAMPGMLRFTYIENDGGAFGVLGGSQLVLLAGSAVAVGVVLWMLFSGEPSRLTSAACGLILGGAAGNLLDRLTTGEVTDYLDLQFWPLEAWPIFNAADIAITTGVALLFLSALRNPDKG